MVKMAFFRKFGFYLLCFLSVKIVRTRRWLNFTPDGEMRMYGSLKRWAEPPEASSGQAARLESKNLKPDLSPNSLRGNLKPET
jgi:hypothetical protein